MGWPSSSRTVSWGSSAITVFTPTMMASLALRICWTQLSGRRAGHPLGVPRPGGYLPVEAHGEFSGDVGHSRVDVLGEGLV